jgi:Arc/MetJ family transcription regulator
MTLRTSLVLRMLRRLVYVDEISRLQARAALALRPLARETTYVDMTLRRVVGNSGRSRRRAQHAHVSRSGSSAVHIGIRRRVAI